MLEFIHHISEAWILRRASGGLGPARRALLERHLGSCARCRGFALDLVEFSHGLEPEASAPRLGAVEQERLHAGVMAAFHRERLSERDAPAFERATGPAVRPVFVKALGALALILGVALALSTPSGRGPETPQRNAEKSGAPNGAVAALEPSPAPTHTVTSTPTPTPAIPKTENK
jgi:hypothetical protein